MLTKILHNFSTDELFSFLEEKSLQFAIEMFPDSNENEIEKKQLANLLAKTHFHEFVFVKKTRELLIERMRRETVVELFPEFNLTINQVNSEHYNAIISWANDNPSLFAKKMGLEFDCLNSNNLKQLESISRIDPTYRMYPYQDEITKTALNKLGNNQKRVLIHLPTGSGKTRTAMNIACEHLRASKNNVVLWLADREELCTQAFNEFSIAWQSLGNRSTSLYGLYSSSQESLSGIDSGFVIAGLQKFLSLRTNNKRKLQLLYNQLRKSVTLVIFDEAHKSVAPQYQEVVKDFINNKEFEADLIGLTATPGRSYANEGLSEEDLLLSNFFFNNKISMKVQGYLSPIDYLVENGYLAKANFESLNYNHSGIAAYELRDSGGTETLKALSKNVERNKKIINTIIDECNKQSQIIVFACSVEHSVNLTTALLYQGIRAASVDSSNDTAESRRMKIKQYKTGKLQVLLNFNVLTAGFDAPRTNVTVIAKPMNSLVQYLQMAGRAMRGTLSGGNDECTIYTVMDDIPEFQSINLAFEYWNDMWTDKNNEGEINE